MEPQFFADYRRDGFAVIENFLSDAEIGQLRAEARRLSLSADPSGNLSIFGTGNQQITDDYFLTSGDKIRFFYERDAVEPATGKFLVADRELAVNKIGHALHEYNEIFRRVTFSQKVQEVARALGLVNPKVIQSMYIYKNPGVGGPVAPHRDGTFLYTEPTFNLCGMWIALDEVTHENGCLWFVPGSQRVPITKRFVRNPNADGARLIFTGTDSAADAAKDTDYVPVPVSRGSCVLIDGAVLHKSEPNRSANPRPAYTFHLMDFPQPEVTWLADNWLQPTEKLPFPRLYSNENS